MRWQTADADTYQQSQAYVDTVLVPLLPMSLGDEMKRHVAIGEYISFISLEMEKQFRGRLLQLPPFVYSTTENERDLSARLQAWTEEFRKSGKNHVIWLTCDVFWKKQENELPGLLLWLPHLPLENLDPSLRQKTISDQMKQILPLIMEEWKKESGLR